MIKMSNNTSKKDVADVIRRKNPTINIPFDLETSFMNAKRFSYSNFH